MRGLILFYRDNQFSLTQIMKAVGVEFTVGQAFICPMHEDHSPSAIAYKDRDSFYCFKEHRRFRGDEVLRKFNYSEEQIRGFVLDDGFIEDDETSHLYMQDVLKLFKEGRISFLDLQKEIYKRWKNLK